MCYKSTEVENTVAEESERDYKEVARGAPFPHLHFTGVFLTYHAVFLTACVRVSNASTTHLREYENR